MVICTETLAAGINLPARSVLLSRLVKGPFGKEKLIDSSTAHQIFGRAGRPQFDTRGFVFALAAEDDVRILRWKEKYDQIPEDTKDPNLLKAKKALKKKKPARREGVQYWSEGQFRQLQAAPPAKLYSKGPLPWRLLAYLLEISPDVSPIRNLVRKRLMDEARMKANERVLDSMLITMEKGGFVRLDPPPPAPDEARPPDAPPYQVAHAHPTPELDKLLVFRSIHPFYGAYLVNQLGIADRFERIQALESVLEMPRPLLRYVRVPLPDRLPPGPLATTRLDQELVQRGLVAAHLVAPPNEEEDPDSDEDEEYPPTLADKLALYFEALYPDVTDFRTQSVWCAGELIMEFNGNFNKFVQTRDLTKQEGIVFRHLLRLILLCGEFAQITPPGTTSEDWLAELRSIAGLLTQSCREVDPTSTDMMIEQAGAVDVVEPALVKKVELPLPDSQPGSEAQQEPSKDFGAGIWD